jgi:hypothetical protein
MNCQPARSAPPPSFGFNANSYQPQQSYHYWIVESRNVDQTNRYWNGIKRTQYKELRSRKRFPTRTVACIALTNKILWVIAIIPSQ